MARKPLAYAGYPESLPDLYACMVEGTCMEPEITHGSCVLIDKLSPIRAGDLVCVYRRPETLRPGEPESIVKRLVYGMFEGARFPYTGNPGDEITPLLSVEQANPSAVAHIPYTEIAAVHRCLGPVERGEGGAAVPKGLIERARAGKA